MSRFTEHFRMSESDVIEYVREKMPDFFGDEELTCHEIGDGNINFVFRVKGAETGKSLIVKHADHAARLTGQEVSLDRNRIETNILLLEGKLAPGTVPVVYYHDLVMSCVIMEDVGDHENMRYAMMRHETFPTFADDITTFMAKTLINTSDNIIDPKEKKRLVQEYTNPDLCEITEQLVYTYPYFEDGMGNSVFGPVHDFIEKELFQDKEMHLEVAKLKEEFKSYAQCLLHGDLHSGSIFVKQGSTKVLDPEFAFYGPAGYDVGNVVAHLIFAWVNAEYTEKDPAKKEKFQKWAEEAMVDTIDLFREKALAEFKANVTDRMAKTEGFAEWYVDGILVNTAATVGIELIRRIVGVAKVKDLTTIEDQEGRAKAEKICVTIAKDCVKHRTEYGKGMCYVAALKKAYEALK